MSWKQYGGIRQNDNLKNVGVGTLVADDIILRKVKVSTHVFDDTIVAKKDIQIHRNLDVSQNVDVCGNLVVHNNIHSNKYIFDTDTTLNKRSYISSDTTLDYIGLGTHNPLAFVDISSAEINTFSARNNRPLIRNFLTQNALNSGVIVDTSNDIANINFQYRNVNKILLENEFPEPRSKISVDISNSIFTIDSSINNIVSKDTSSFSSKNGTVISTLSGDNTIIGESNIITSVSGDITITSQDAVIITGISGDIDISSNMGNVNIISSESTKLKSAVRISERDDILPIKNEPFTIYDNSQSEPFVPKYYNDSNLKTGNSIVCVANGNSETTFAHLLTPDVKGLSIGGGAFVKDASRASGLIGLSTTDASFIPSQSYVSNNNIIYRTTTGINTYAPQLNNYVMDINGPTRIGNGELHPIINHTSKLTDVQSSKENRNYVFISGRREKNVNEGDGNIPETYGYSSVNSGKTWNKVLIEKNDVNQKNDTNLFCINDKAYIISSNARIHRYDFVTNIIDLSNEIINDIRETNSIYVKGNSIIFPGKNTQETNSTPSRLFYTDITANFNNLIKGDLSTIQTNITNIVSSDGFGDKVYFVGDGIQTIDYSDQSSPQLTNHITLGNYNTVSAYDTNKAIAAGTNVISYTNDGGNTWNNVTHITINGNNITQYVIKKLSMLSNGDGLAIGTYNSGTLGIIIYMKANSNIWETIPLETAFYSFGNEEILKSTSINNVCISKDGGFVFTNVTQEVSNDNNSQSYISGSSTVYYGLYPALFDVYNNKVLDVNGGMNVQGQILQF